MIFVLFHVNFNVCKELVKYVSVSFLLSFFLYLSLSFFFVVPLSGTAQFADQAGKYFSLLQDVSTVRLSTSRHKYLKST